jgi:succinate dehydrogenase/fumarate reductase flavoprotein subunit
MSTAFEVRRAREIARWNVEADVVVVGLGCAGASAALEASAAGADVLVVERGSAGGGTSAMSGGVIYLGGGTPVQRECGFEDTPEEMFKYLMASCGAHRDESKIRAYAEDSVAQYHWLVDQGVPFKAAFYPHYSGEPPNDDGLVFSGSENAHPYNEIARPAARGHVPRIPGKAGGLLMEKLIASLERTKARVLTDTRCQTLVVGDDGAVVGAVLKHFGEESVVRARKGVVLTAGGFIMNREMVAAHAPDLARCQFLVGGDGDDGSGILMGVGAGGLALNMAMGSISLPIIPPKKLQFGILVNASGQRFVNEDSYYGRLGEHVMYRQDGRAWLVCDERTFERPEVPREIAAVGESAAELETALHLPAGSLVATLGLYNRHAARGEDPVFRKSRDFLAPLEPPYAALDCCIDTSFYASFTLGGLRTTVDGEVMRPDGALVPGLYAAGRTAAGLAAPGYSSGISLGDGSYFGRRAGRKAARA